MKILPTLLLMLLPFYVFGVYGCSDDNSGDEQIQKFTLAEVDLQQNFTKERESYLYRSALPSMQVGGMWLLTKIGVLRLKICLLRSRALRFW